MSGDQLNLDAIERRAHFALNGADPVYRCREVVRADVPALVAEVRRLRDRVEELEGDDSGTGPFVIPPPPTGPVEIQ